MGREVSSSLFCFDRQLTLVSYILKRKKCVLLLSTMHHDDAFTLKTQYKYIRAAFGINSSRKMQFIAKHFMDVPQNFECAMK
ncbi:hypothetical protein T09_12335 [Trichinella sp. T9]|nr:hypothetical protein T09_12335 [Trichinella sp. T9]